MRINFKKQARNGIGIFASADTQRITLIQDDNSRCYIRMLDRGQWCYPEWQDPDGFASQDDAENFLVDHDWQSADAENIEYDTVETGFIFNILGMRYNPDTDKYEFVDRDRTVQIIGNPANPLSVEFIHDEESESRDYCDMEEMICDVEDTILSYTKSVFSKRMPVTAAINVKNLASQLFRVKSSNVWAYRLFLRDRHDKTGDLIVQFKHKDGGAGDVYIYYDVPFMVFRKWQATQSKGHYFWKHIRNYYKYSKLTGDKIGKLKNAVNHYEHNVTYDTGETEPFPTCRYLLEFVSEFTSGKIDRQQFVDDVQDYYYIGLTDLEDESKKFATEFKNLIINVINKHTDYGDDRLKRVLIRNMNILNRILNDES